MAEQFDLNRSAVRSDLRQLVDVGIIERISGHGSKVRDHEEWNILDPQVTDWISRFAYPNPRIQRGLVEPLDRGMILSTATQYRDVARKSPPRDNH